MEWTKAYIGLGSNLGDRRGFLALAERRIGGLAGVEVEGVSSVHETVGVGMARADAGTFLNSAMAVRTTLGPLELLRALREIERDLGRVRSETPAVGSQSRTIDLDLLMYGSVVMDTPELTLPHPRMHERAFVLKPLAEVGAEALHPVLGRTVGEIGRGEGPEAHRR